MKIGIIGAMKIEVEKLCSMAENVKKEKVGGIEFNVGDLCGHQVIIAVCGVGKVFAAMCAQAMILNYSPDAIINTGVAGALASELRVGDVAVAENVVQHDMDTSPIGDPVGLISGINMVQIPADEKISSSLKKTAADLGMTCLSGTIASGDQFIADKAKKAYIKNTFSAIACEMEGAAIGQVCYVNGTPFGILRSISDNGDESAGMSYDKFIGVAVENSVKILTEFLNKTK